MTTDNEKEKFKGLVLSKKLKIIASLIIAIAAVVVPIYTFITDNKKFEATINNSDRQFELVNRPYIELMLPKMVIIGNELERGEVPEIQFEVLVYALNQGRVPASVRKVECFIEDIEGELRVPLGWSKARENFDVFPYMGSNSYKLSRGPYLGVGDVKKIMKIDDELYGLSKDKNSDFWKSNSFEQIKKKFQDQIKPFYLVFQIEYFKIGDHRKRSQPYYYLVRFKADGLNGFEFYESMSENSKTGDGWVGITKEGNVRDMR